MFFPVRTDRRLTTTPWVNYTLIALNVVIFLLTRDQIQQLDLTLHQLNQLGVTLPRDLILEHYPVRAFYLDPQWLKSYQFLTYQFLHADWMHLLGNMLFLYVFGNSIEDRLGKIGYLLFYLGGGVMAGVGHALIEPTPVLGASGAVAAVTGAFLALFPLSNVTIVYWFIVVGAFEITGMWLILFQIAQNIVFQFMGGESVAYLAHLAGYGYGFVVGMGLLMLRLLPREPYDMLALLERRRRRAQFRRMTRQGYQPWQAPPESPSEASSNARTATATIPPHQESLMKQRSEIAAALSRHDVPTAARLYRQLLIDHPDQIMSQQQQLDLANQLMSEGRYDDAATAYELLLKHYGSYPQIEQVQLILALIYARYLHQPQRAQSLLQEALGKLHGSDRQLAQQILQEVAV